MRKLYKKRILVPVIALAFLIVGSSYKSDFFEIAKQIEIFTTLFKELNMNYVDETNPAKLMDTAIKHMLDDLDPYTKFLNEQDVEDYKISNAGEYSGIGALVRSYKDRLLIVEPYEGYPADLAGLKAGDEIIQIGDIKVSEFDDNASELLKGANESEIEIQFKRQGKTQTTKIKRAGVEVDAVPFYDMVDDKTGYIVLSRFNRKASSQTQAAIIDLKGKGATQLILDLRGNPGGLLSEAINVTNLFVPKGELIVTTKSKVKKFNQEYKTKNKPLDTEIPLVVLINGRSASASEIVSGGLQDLDRAVVVGARSFGKGLVQRPLKLTYGTQLKVTISRYYTPSGRCIQSLDYWNRDENGKAVRNTQFNEFKTRNGRTVEDGGGVLPDVQIAALNSNTLVDALDAGNVIFDFATDYYYKNPLGSIADFNFTAKDYAAFKTFATQADFSFKTKTEVILEQRIAEENKLLGKEVQEKYKELLGTINTSKFKALDTYEAVIKKKITEELIPRYFYRKGLYNYNLEHDEAIQTATVLLSDTNKYKNILNN
ncbi:S41 family peptidase [Croceivirga sp. JEA036]|uniref:S41 family peptidase n=1 Tax=Croceivirga sp. JEA036 TaxID=2721162 RepID=UPI001439BE23|nr:S41 family peptidase [Croceivirga sp. JEA036]NJB37032.1 S41 family peptidase [Croceivirga sp. JEA036]